MKNLFDNISPKNKEKILKIVEANTVKYSKDVNVISGANAKNYIALIEYGAVQIVLNDYNGNQIILEDLESGEVFGTMMSVLNSDECSIITKEKTTITFIDYDGINNSDLVRSEFYIIFIRNLLNIMSSQINNKNERIRILTKRSIRDKLLEYFKITGKGAKRFELKFSFTELANYICVDRCAMTRELSHLKNEGFIKINNKQITLLY